MPQKSIQDEPGGNATPKVTNPNSTVNTVKELIHNELLIWIAAGERELGDLHHMFELIRALATDLNGQNPVARLERIAALARMGAFIADDTANEMEDCQARTRCQLEQWGMSE
jgi:hypothetical protein